MVRVVVLLVSTVALARILAPSDFGLMAITLSVAALGELLRDFGLTTAAAREVTLTAGQKANLFWVNALLGIAAGAATWACSRMIAEVFAQPELASIVTAMSVTFVLNGLAAQFRAEINRDLRFRQLALVDTAPAVLALGLTLIAAVWEQSYWILVLQQITTSAVGLILAVSLARWIPGMPTRGHSIRKLIRYGAAVAGTQSVAFVTRNIDNLAIGYGLGPNPLGLYSRAYQLLMTPINQITAPLTRVFVPTLSRLANKPAAHSDQVRRVQTIPVIVLGTLYAGCAGLAEPLVLLLFGDRWLEMVPVFQVLAIGGVFRAFNQVVYWVFLSLGAAGAQFRFYLWSQPLIIACILTGLQWGILGVAIGHSVGYAINWLLSLWACRRATGFETQPLLRHDLLAMVLIVLPVGLGGLAFSAAPLPNWGKMLLGAIAIGFYGLAVGRLSRFGRQGGADLVQTLRQVHS